MLCPIHKASQLPNDTPQFESTKNSKSSAERKSYIHQDKVKTIISNNLTGTSDILASPTNLILSTNQSTGSKPEELGNLTSLINLQLGANHLEALVGLGYPVGYSSGYWNYCHQVHTSVVMIHRREI
ncbi:uncharacterized protein LOC121764659 isoform X1 [Salvia splendens]|uniref:uncharacterized protein LOC121764659 isoform X1 n=1 Tax=Salvia splendens TaxID=180675 RepID=UPI001C252094|nr:uncharacterized protein LOC121764659 isoform X1 [Salvia splendens]